jgi:GxxExxY protein
MVSRKELNRQGRQGRQGIVRMHEPAAELDDMAREVIAAAMEVHTVLGSGFLESVYEQSLAVELALRNIACVRQHPIALSYKGHAVGEARLDFLVGGSLVVELKAVEALHGVHYAQVLNYLKATGFKLGLLLNSNVEHLRDGIKRVVLTK